MFHMELAPLGGILGPLKSDLGVFWAKIPLYPYNIKFSKSIFSKSANLPILSFWILNLHIIICQFQRRSTKKHFFFSHCMLLPLVQRLPTSLASHVLGFIIVVYHLASPTLVKVIHTHDNHCDYHKDVPIPKNKITFHL